MFKSVSIYNNCGHEVARGCLDRVLWQNQRLSSLILLNHFHGKKHRYWSHKQLRFAQLLGPTGFKYLEEVSLW